MRSSRRLWLALALVLAVAGSTRLARLDLIEFKADEAMVAGHALDAALGYWPAASLPTSNGGLDEPPLPLYLFAVPALFTHDPAWMAAVSGLFDALGVLLVFLIGRRYFCGRAGLAGAGFYAAAAYPAMFSRKLAGPYLEPFFAALLLWCLLRADGRVLKPTSWPWFGAVLALGALVLIHLGALLLAPALALLVAIDMWRRRSWAPLLWAAGGAVLVGALSAPYLAYELSSRSTFLSMVGQYVQGAPGWTAQAFEFVWVTLTSPGYGDLMGPTSALFNAESWPAGYLTPLAGVAAVGGLAAALWRSREQRYLTLAVVALVPLVITLHHGPGLQIHYFAFLLPVCFLLAGIGFDALLSAAPALRAPAFAALAVLLLVQTLNFRHFTDFVQRHALPEGYGLPLAYKERLFEQATSLAGGHRVVVATASRDEEEPAHYLLRGVANAAADPEAGLLLPRDGGLYAVLSRRTAAAHALDSVLPPAYSEPLPGGANAAIYQLPPAGDLPLGALGITAATPVDWLNGISLLGVAAPRSLPAQLTAAWKVTAPVDGSTLFFSQLVDDDGKQWFDRDGAPAPASAWQPGDSLITFTPAAVPRDALRQEYWWSLGLYTEGGRRVPLRDGALDARVARLKGGQGIPPAPPLRPVSAVFDGAIELQGYAVDSEGVILEWKCLSPVDRDYTVFVHALDGSGAAAGQADAQPDHYPTSLWDRGEMIIDRHAIRGSRVEVGLYDLASGQRLRLAGGGDRVELALATSPAGGA